MRVILDTGALIALERNDRAMWQRLKQALQAREAPVSHGGIVGQAWRGRGSRQALLAKALDVIDIRPLDAGLGRAAGELLARAKQNDVIDAALVLLANDGDRVITSDPDDLAPLARAADLDIELVTP
jgi:predicted nucleic acid-binding protein